MQVHAHISVNDGDYSSRRTFFNALIAFSNVGACSSMRFVVFWESTSLTTVANTEDDVVNELVFAIMARDFTFFGLTSVLSL